MNVNQNGMLPIVNREYEVTYKNEYDQVEVLYGVLVHPDLNGLIVISKEGKRIIIPKDRIFILREADIPTSGKATQKDQAGSVKQEGQ
jgi:hypothetical protein